MNQRRFFVPTCLLAVAGLVPFAVSAQSSWYLGASAGQSSIDATSADVESGFLADDGFIARNTTLDKTDAGGKAYLGYRFNRFFAAEGGYVDLGKASFNTTIIGAPPGTSPAPPFPIHATATARGVFLSGLAHWPLTDNFSLFGKAGLFRWEAKFTERITGTDITRVNRSERKTDANYGFGVLWQFTQALGARLEWERFKDVGQSIGGREGRDVDFISAGVLVQF